MRTVLALTLLSLIACGRDEAPKRGVPARDAADLLIDRNWLDRWPEQKDDHLTVYRFVPSMGGGVFQDRTVFKGTFELFLFETDGKHIDFNFPHDGTRKRSGFRIERVDGPEPFTFKLTIDGDPRGKGTYWSSDELSDLDTLLTAER